MDVTELIVEVRDRNFNRVGQFSDSDLVGFTVVPRTNDIGSWQAQLPNVVFDIEGGREVQYDLTTALRTKGSGIIVTGPNGVILSGSMTEAQYHASTEEEQGYWSFTGVSDTSVLADALAYPQPTNGDATTQTQDNDVRSGAAETVIKQYVSANIGANAVSSRKWSDLSMEFDAGIGGNVVGSARFDNLLTLVQNLASIGGVNFDVVQVGNGRVLRVWDPLDRSALVRFDIQNGQLSNIEYGYGVPTVTGVIVGGPGDNVIDRTFVQRTSAAATAESLAWGRRIEGFISDTSTDDTTVLSQQGDEVLATEGVTVTSTSITPSEDLTSTFMVDWGLGDYVSAIVENVSSVAPVSEVVIKVGIDGVLIGATLGDPVGFDADGVSYARSRSASNRIESIERAGSNGSGGGSGAGVYWDDIQQKPAAFPADLNTPTGVLVIGNGGTGASTAATARTNLGLGSLATKSSVNLSVDASGILPLTLGGTGGSTAATARTGLGLGTLATASSVDLTAQVSGALPLTNGGTGGTTAATARTGLGLGSLATLSAVSLTTNVNGTLPLGNGGTGATTDSGARTALGLGSLATQSTVDLNTGQVSNVLPVAKGGTGSTNAAAAIQALNGVDYDTFTIYSNQLQWAEGPFAMTSGYTLGSNSYVRRLAVGLVILNITVTRAAGITNGAVVGAITPFYAPSSGYGPVSAYGSGSSATSPAGIRVDTNGNLVALVSGTTTAVNVTITYAVIN